MQKALAEFRNLFLLLPGYKVLDITSHTDAISQYLNDALEEVNGRLSLVQYPGEHGSVRNANAITPQVIENYESPFRALPRDNDVVVIRDVIQHHKNIDALLKIAYRTLANAGEIIIMTQKEELISSRIYEALDKAEFRATNTIDIFDNYELIMAKKMHMWGNGL